MTSASFEARPITVKIHDTWDISLIADKQPVVLGVVLLVQTEVLFISGEKVKLRLKKMTRVVKDFFAFVKRLYLALSV